MSLNSVQPSSGLQTPSRVARAGGEGAPAARGGGAAETDTVRLSDRGRMMSRLEDLAPTTPDKLRKLSAALATDLRDLFRQNGVDARRGVGFEVDSPTGRVSVTPNRPDAPAIAALIDSRPAIARQIDAIAVLSRHVVAAEQAADSRQAGRWTSSAAQIDSVVADFAARFGAPADAPDFALIPGSRAGNAAGMRNAIAQYAAVSDTSGAATFALVFNGADVAVYADGRRWTSAGA